MSKVIELFGHAADNEHENWQQILDQQPCPFLGRRCYKVRKSDPGTSIGTCSVFYGRDPNPVIICPTRLIQGGRIFTDCIHLLSNHEPGNDFHVVSEISVPGGSVDFFLVSARGSAVRDFVGIELQTLDTTGTVWPERQRLVRELGIEPSDEAEFSNKTFGMNWKMTAKTILVQMHHKVQTFEHVNKKLVLVVQDCLLRYMQREFQFGHMKNPALAGDSMHIHSYTMARATDDNFGIQLDSRLSTDANGIGACLGLQAEARIELMDIIRRLEQKISPHTIFRPF